MKKRKEMTDEQKAALVERLAKARAAKGTPQYKGVHQSVLDLPEEDPHSYKSIKRWIKTNKDLASSLSRDWRFNKTKGALAKSEMHKGYVRHLEYYLKHGDWISNWDGEYMEGRTKWKCVAMAYHPSGRPKRSIGVWYPDYMCEWTKELDIEERKMWGEYEEPKNTRRSKKKR